MELNTEMYFSDNICNIKGYISDRVCEINTSREMICIDFDVHLMVMNVYERVVDFISRCENSVLTHNTIMMYLEEYFMPWDKCEGLVDWWADEDNPYYDSSIAYDIRYSINHTIEG